mgnify:CR=1 FL=1
MLAVTGLDGFFDLIVGGDSRAEKKPQRCVLLHVMQALESSAQRTAHVGGSSIDVQAARNAGDGAVAIGPGLHTRHGWRPGLQAAPGETRRVYLDDIEAWCAQMDSITDHR